MFKRTIGFFYINDPNWIGGMDYVVNAVNSLCSLDKAIQPEIDLIITEDVDTDSLRLRIQYDKYAFYKLPVSNKKSPVHLLNNRFRWSFIYPFPKGKMYDRLFRGLSEKRKIFWIPDFQEEYFPHLFDDIALEKRRRTRSFFANQKKSIVVFSSETALNDFKCFYGPRIMANTKVLRFANPDKWQFSSTFIEQTLKKYDLTSNDYFICPNQMWEHKNHQIVLDAVKMCSQKNSNLKVVFCGKEHDPRNPRFALDLKTKGVDLVEKGNIKFLGFLPKDEQMCLIQESIGLLQPSNFEGWSTTIEDGITLNKLIIAKGLVVNKEQLGAKGIYFDTIQELEDTLLKFYNTKEERYIQIKYPEDRVEKFAKKLISLNL